MLTRYLPLSALDPSVHGLDHGGFLKYANLYILGENFELEALSDEALSYLGQHCDAKLQAMCTYDSILKQGAEGVVDKAQNLFTPHDYDDLYRAIYQAFGERYRPSRLTSLIASFVWAGRERLFSHAQFFHQISEQFPYFAKHIFQAILGYNESTWVPGKDVARATCATLDHTKKTQHPDRCDSCLEVFGHDAPKSMYNPFKVAVRPCAWCVKCVDKNKGTEVPLWRCEPEKKRDE